MRPHRTGAAFLVPLLLSGILHAAAIPFMHRAPAAAPAPPALAMIELPIELGGDAPPALGLPEGADQAIQADHGGIATSPPRASAACGPGAAGPASTLVAAHAAHTAPAMAASAAPATSASAPPPDKEDERRKLREAVEKAMLAKDDGSPAVGKQEGSEKAKLGSPDGSASGQGKTGGAGVGYLGGWFSSMVGARSLSLTAEEKAKATAIAVVTIQDGQIVSAALSQPGEIAAYNQAVAGSLGGLVGRKVPPNSDGEFPTGTFSLRLKAR